MNLQSIHASLLDDLRNATEFYKCVQQETQAGADCTGTGAWADAHEWLSTAAINLGEALIADYSAGEVSHA